MMRKTPYLGLGLGLVAVGIWAALVPFVGPTFGYSMGGAPAWQWSASHTELHLLPGLVVIVAGALLMWSSRGSSIGGATLGAVAGIWLVLGPSISTAWLDGMSGMSMGESTWMQVISPLGYHYLPGVLVLGISALALGSLAAAPRRERGLAPAAATTADPSDGSSQPRERGPAIA